MDSRETFISSLKNLKWGLAHPRIITTDDVSWPTYRAGPTSNQPTSDLTVPQGPSFPLSRRCLTSSLAQEATQLPLSVS